MNAQPKRPPWESAIVVRLPSTDAMIAAVRRRFDLPRKPNGIPPHITAIVPFLPRSEVESGETLASLRSVCAATEPFEVTLARTARFPRVLYLAPEPAEPFIGLSRRIMDRWPNVTPYAGEHRQVIPHLTVTTSQPPTVFDRVAEALAPELPVSAVVDAAQLYLFDGGRWTERAALPFRQPEHSPPQG